MLGVILSPNRREMFDRIEALFATIELEVKDIQIVVIDRMQEILLKTRSGVLSPEARFLRDQLVTTTDEEARSLIARNLPMDQLEPAKRVPGLEAILPLVHEAIAKRATSLERSRFLATCGRFSMTFAIHDLVTSIRSDIPAHRWMEASLRRLEETYTHAFGESALQEHLRMAPENLRLSFALRLQAMTDDGDVQILLHGRLLACLQAPAAEARRRVMSTQKEHFRPLLDETWTPPDSAFIGADALDEPVIQPHEVTDYASALFPGITITGPVPDEGTLLEEVADWVRQQVAKQIDKALALARLQEEIVAGIVPEILRRLMATTTPDEDAWTLDCEQEVLATYLERRPSTPTPAIDRLLPPTTRAIRELVKDRLQTLRETSEKDTGPPRTSDLEAVPDPPGEVVPDGMTEAVEPVGPPPPDPVPEPQNDSDPGSANPPDRQAPEFPTVSTGASASTGGSGPGGRTDETAQGSGTAGEAADPGSGPGGGAGPGDGRVGLSEGAARPARACDRVWLLVFALVSGALNLIVFLLWLLRPLRTITMFFDVEDQDQTFHTYGPMLAGQRSASGRGIDLGPGRIVLEFTQRDLSQDKGPPRLRLTRVLR